MKGRGDYTMTPDEAAATIQKAVKAAVGKGLRGAGGAAGNFIGSKFGLGAAGKSFGRGVGAKLSRLLGSGDYTTNQGDVMANSLFGKGGGGAGGPGTFESMSGGVRLKHREYIQDIYLPSTAGFAFTNRDWVVNPGLSYVFPYLSQIAANFEQYRFHGLVFEFVSSTSQYGQAALGTYVMAMEYNSAAPAFTTKPQMENSDYALSARLDKSGMYGVECAKSAQAQEYYYVRAPGQTVVPNLYDTGLMQVGIATTTVASGTGLINGSSIGELWVTYDVELIRPRISVFRPGYAHIRGTGVAAATPLGVDGRAIVSFGSLSGLSATANVMTFPNAAIGDIYQIVTDWKGQNLVGGLYPSLNVTGMTQFNLLQANALNSALATPLAAATDQFLLTQYWIVTSEQPNAVTFTYGLLGVYPSGAVTTVDVVITNLGNGLINTSL